MTILLHCKQEKKPHHQINQITKSQATLRRMMKKASSLSDLEFDAGDMLSTFFCPVSDDGTSTPTAHRWRLTKVFVISAGNVGLAIMQTILTCDLADKITLVDSVSDKLRGQMLDM
jgi:L-lactate dehydrogenase